MKTLAEVRGKIDRVRQEMLAAGRTEGLERVDWLLTTIDWLLALRRGGREAAGRTANSDGWLPSWSVPMPPATPRPASGRGRPTTHCLGCGLREALQTYPRKMSTMGEFGTLATINVKAYAAFLQLVERLRRIDASLPELKPESPVRPDEPPRIVMRIPSSTARPGEPLTVQAAVLSGQPIRSVTVNYRGLGSGVVGNCADARAFRRTFAATLPAESLARGGLEFFVAAEDEAGRRAVAPVGYPNVTWSVTGFEPRVAAARRRGQRRHSPRRRRPCEPNWQATTKSGCVGPSRRLIAAFVTRSSAAASPISRPAADNRLATSYLPPVYDLVDGSQANLHYAVVAVAPSGQRSPPARVTLAFARPAPPEPPTGLVAKAAPGKVILTWKSPDNTAAAVQRVSRRGTVRRVPRKVAERVRGGDGPSGQRSCRPTWFISIKLKSVDLGGQESAPSEMASAEPTPLPREPVLSAAFDGDAKAMVAPGVRRRSRPGLGARAGGFRHGAPRPGPGCAQRRLRHVPLRPGLRRERPVDARPLAETGHARADARVGIVRRVGEERLLSPVDRRAVPLLPGRFQRPRYGHAANRSLDARGGRV